MKYIKWILGYVFAIGLLCILLVGSIRVTVYHNEDYFRQEYEKYQVHKAVDMEMDDLISMTTEMMEYLMGSREDLNIITTIGGEEKEFFNDREKAHMVDVKNLLQLALTVMRVSIVAVIAIAAVFIWRKWNPLHVFSRAIQVVTGVVFVITAGLAAIISTDFNKYFNIFHHIFFDNDLWILDPATDRLINIVPEPFFMDTALRIGGIILAGLVVLFAASTWYLKKEKRKTRRKV